MKRILRFLRSPKLAFGLVLGVAAYAVIGTVFPQASLDSAKVLVWASAHPVGDRIAHALGLYHAYSTPFFLVLLGLLAASTAACAWTRTARAHRMYTADGKVGEALVSRLKSRPQAVVAVADGAVALAQAGEALRSRRLRIREGKTIVQGSSGRFALIGSPVFHWALVGLFLVVVAGQLTRSEGQMGVPVGSTRPDQPSSYGVVEHGPLARTSTGLGVGVVVIQKTLVQGGVDRGASPEVTLSRDSAVLKRQLVYPNHPLRYGSYLIHRGAFGYSVPVSLVTSDGVVATSLDVLIDTEESAATGTRPGSFELSGLPGGAFDATITLAPEHGPKGGVILTPAPKMTLGVRTSRGVVETLTIPGAMDIEPGFHLEFGRVVSYARLTVVRDWSVYWIYAALVVAIVGLTLAILIPYRSAWVLLVRTPEGDALHIVTSHSRREPGYAESIEQAVREACGAEEDRT